MIFEYEFEYETEAVEVRSPDRWKRFEPGKRTVRAFRTFRLIHSGTRQLMPGLDDGQTEVSSFNTPRCEYVAEGKPETRNFLMEPHTYALLGSPSRIRVTVQPIGEDE